MRNQIWLKQSLRVHSYLRRIKINFRGLQGVEMMSSIKVYWFSYAVINQNDMLEYGYFLQVGGKSLNKSLKEWNFFGYKFVTIAFSSKDIELGLKGAMESFPSFNLQ